MFIKNSIRKFVVDIHEHVIAYGKQQTEYVEMDFGGIMLRSYYYEGVSNYYGERDYTSILEADGWSIKFGSCRDMQSFGDKKKMEKDLIICKLFMDS